MAKPTLKITVNGVEHTRQTAREYTHVVVARVRRDLEVAKVERDAADPSSCLYKSAKARFAEAKEIAEGRNWWLNNNRDRIGPEETQRRIDAARAIVDRGFKAILAEAVAYAMDRALEKPEAGEWTALSWHSGPRNAAKGERDALAQAYEVRVVAVGDSVDLA